MALSVFDLTMMNKADQDKITMATDMWQKATTKAEKDSWHNFAESIRSSYGYSGDTKDNFASGSGYTQTGFAIPRMGDYSQTPDGQKWMPQIEDILSKINDREPFEWNKDTDEGYQAFMGEVTRMAEKTFNDTIAGASVGTGGRPNSWAGTVASQSMGDMLMQGAGQMQNFKQFAYQMYKDEGQLDFQKLETLMGIDSTMYGRFVDQYNSEVQTYNMAVENKEREIQNAMNRTELAGYVSNADALILGVPVGTLSAQARQRAWDMEDYLAKAKIDLAYTPAKSGGGGDDADIGNDPESKWTSTNVWNNLKARFGMKDSQLGGTPQERGQALYEYYKSGYINASDMQEYAIAHNAVLPEGATMTVEENAKATTVSVSYKQVEAQIQRLFDTVADANERDERIEAYVTKHVNNGDLTKEQGDALLDKYGI